MVGNVIGWGKAIGENPRVHSIVVRQSSHASDDATRIVSDIVDFVNVMLHEGHYVRSELPPNAMRAFHTDYYLAQVANGGHAKFVSNSGWAPGIIQDIREGLRAMEAEPFEEIFQDLCRLIDRDNSRVRRIAQGSGSGTINPEIKELDQRFIQHDVDKTFSQIIARWLRSLPELEVSPDEKFAIRLREVCQANPRLVERKAARMDARLNENLHNPVWVAGRLLCLEAGCTPMLSIGSGDRVAIAPDGVRLTGWSLQTGQGRRLLQIGQQHSFLSETYLADGTKLTDELIAEMRNEMLAPDTRVPARFANMEQREIARLPTKVVEIAIATAKSVPIVRIARDLLKKLDSGETLQDVYAGGVLSNGGFMWIVETEKRALLFSFRDTEAVLTDIPPASDLAVVSLARLKAQLDREKAGTA